MKLATFFISKTIQNYTKSSTVSESPLKTNMLPWAFLGILLVSAVICKQRLLKTILYNKLQTTNAMTLIKTISESPFKVLQIP